MISSDAGVSTNAGLPDYRSVCGLLHVFNRHSTNKTLFENEEFVQFAEQIKTCKYTKGHELSEMLHKLWVLKRVYTQNIHGLYHQNKLSPDKLVEFHGSVKKKNIILYGMDISAHAIQCVPCLIW